MEVHCAETCFVRVAYNKQDFSCDFLVSPHVACKGRKFQEYIENYYIGLISCFFLGCE